MQRPFKFTKIKLIAGYAAILLLSLFAIGFIYNQTMSLAQKDDIEQLTRRKLFLTSNTLAKLYEAEGISLAFMQTDSKSNFSAYMRLMEEVGRSIDTLKRLSNTEAQALRLDTINSLLSQRLQNLRQLMYVKRYYIPEDFYNKAMEEIESLRDTSDQELNIVTRYVTREDSSYVKNEGKRPGFFRRLLGGKEREDSVLQITTYRQLQVDTILSPPAPSTDTVINTIREMWVEFQQQKKEIAERVYRQELAVIQSGQAITERIKQILNDLEQEEINNTLAKLNQQRAVNHQIAKTVAWIGIVACVLVILFVFLILSDISQSQRYRKQLEEAKQYTEQLLHNREKLMLTVTHDIKSPLSSIISYIELLNNTRLEERQHYFLQNMKSSSEHILHLANNMLDFSKLEARQMEVSDMPYNPRQLLQEAADSFLPLAAGKGLALESHISKGLDGSYCGDPLKIRQIVVNLLSNAVKYTRQGRVELSAFTATDRSDTLVAVVKDTGPGMTEEEQGLIFKEFTRLEAEQGTGVEGTGLGLTITLQLVQLLGGALTLASEKGVGSTFTVRLPLRRGKADADALPDAAAVAGDASPDGGGSPAPAQPGASVAAGGTPSGDGGPAAPSPSENPAPDAAAQPKSPIAAAAVPLESSAPAAPEEGGRIRALLVDDDTVQLSLRSTVLGMAGVACTPCTDPREALPLLEDGDFDIVFSDIQMPEMDGFELIRRIRESASPKVSGVPVIAMSGRDDIRETEYLEAGFSAFVSKVTSPAQLIARVNGLLGCDLRLPEAEEPEPRGEKLYDLASIRLFADNDEEAVAQIAEAFLADCRANFDLLREHLERGDWEAISRLAHKMLPMFRQFGIRSVVPLLESLERMDTASADRETVAGTVDAVVRQGRGIAVCIRMELRL